MVKINPQPIRGRWAFGVALDFHTINSVPTVPDTSGRMQFDTSRPPVGDLLYRYKYLRDDTAAPGLVDAAVGFLRPHRSKIEIIVPVPPSTHRLKQPVLVLARKIGRALGIPVVDCVRLTRSSTPLKGIADLEKRRELVDGLYAVDRSQTEGRSILLFDDLYRSGTTMNAITDILVEDGKAKIVRALVLTKTRSHQ